MAYKVLRRDYATVRYGGSPPLGEFRFHYNYITVLIRLLIKIISLIRDSRHKPSLIFAIKVSETGNLGSFEYKIRLKLGFPDFSRDAKFLSVATVL